MIYPNSELAAGSPLETLGAHELTVGMSCVVTTEHVHQYPDFLDEIREDARNRGLLVRFVLHRDENDVMIAYEVACYARVDHGERASVGSTDIYAGPYGEIAEQEDQQRRAQPDPADAPGEPVDAAQGDDTAKWTGGPMADGPSVEYADATNDEHANDWAGRTEPQPWDVEDSQPMGEHGKAVSEAAGFSEPVNVPWQSDGDDGHTNYEDGPGENDGAADTDAGSAPGNGPTQTPWATGGQAETPWAASAATVEADEGGSGSVGKDTAGAIDDLLAAWFDKDDIENEGLRARAMVPHSWLRQRAVKRAPFKDANDAGAAFDAAISALIGEGAFAVSDKIRAKHYEVNRDAVWVLANG